MHMDVIKGKCVVNLFDKDILVAGSFHVKMTDAQPYASKSILLSEFQPILSLQGRYVPSHFLLEHFEHLIDYCY